MASQHRPPSRSIDRALLLVLDSCGCGAAPDAARYGDEGANTLGNLARAAGGLRLPNLQRLPLANRPDLAGVPREARPSGAAGRLREQSAGKDTTTGHWEIAGLVVDKAFPTFPHGFPRDFIDRFVERSGRGVLGNTT